MSDDDIGTVRWFGESWNAPVNDPRAKVAVPSGMVCGDHRTQTNEVIGLNDQGLMLLSYEDGITMYVPYHLNCFLDGIGVPHG